MSKKDRIALGRPSDASFKAFKEFALSMVAILAPNAEDALTEDEWWDFYEDFWKDKATDKRPGK